ncbi:MAG: ribonuclease P protein component [Mycoplasmataceae bacterium]|jgi:ribonuclease P protein component|nr:ribonuclease P protein component [Mycoplasmataceae bacterium]
MKNKNICVLKKTKDFAFIIQNHKVFNNVIFKIKAIPNNLNILRYGLAVNKKNFPKAVTRNLIKRQLRQMIQKLEAKSVDMIVVVKSNYINNKYISNQKFFNEVYNLIHF